MNKRGRKPPVHEPLVCTGCGEPPRIKDERVLPCECGAKWNVHLLDERTLPRWALLVEWPE